MDPLRQLCLGIVFALALNQAAGADAPAVAEFDADRFNALSDEQKVGYVLSVLEARDRKLSNFKYVLRENCTNVDKQTGARRFMVKCEYEVRRLGPQLWMHLTKNKFWTEADDVDSEGFVNWNGKVAVSLVTPHTNRAPYHSASVRDQPSENFGLKKYNELLGLRIQVHNDSVPLAEFLRTSVARKDPIVIQADRRRPDATEVKVEVRRLHARWSFWMDPTHDYMISRCEYRYELNANFNARHSEVTVPTKISGVWVPKEALHVTESSSYHERSEFKYQVTIFEIGSVTPADVEIRYPTGTRVTDTLSKVVYVVLPDGRRQMEPLAMVDEKTLRVPPKNAVTALPVAEAAKLYTEQPLVLVTPPPKVSPRLRIFVIALNAIVVVAAVGFYYLRRKKRRLAAAT